MPLEVNEVIINVTFPPDKLGIVMMQPYIRLNGDAQPYKWFTDNNKVTNQLAVIKHTLSISKEKTHGANKTHFTLFPEYSIPGLEGVKLIDDVVNESDWENGTIIIGGIHGLNKTEYTELCGQSNVEVANCNKPVNVSTTEWVNCIITWVKETDGKIIKFVQPKCCPCLEETFLPDSEMFKGNAITMFKCKRDNIDFRFLSMICYDWIGSLNGNLFFWNVLEKIQEIFLNDARPLDLCFVIMHNPKPNDSKFLQNARDFFQLNNNYTGVLRHNTLLFFVNSAGGNLPGQYVRYGGSCIIYSPDSRYFTTGNLSTYATSTKKIRKSNILDRCKDSYLREQGECVHSLNLTLPHVINLDHTGRQKHLKAKVHPIDTTSTDKRIPNEEVPASVKWINDKLDIDCSSSCNSLYEHPNFCAQIETSHKELISQLRKLDDKRIVNFIECAIFDLLLFLKNGKDLRNTHFEDRIIRGNVKQHIVDHWEEEEITVLKEILYILSILKICYLSLTIENSIYHASIECRGQLFNILYVEHVNDFDTLQKTILSDGKSIVILILKTNHVLQNITHVKDDTGKSKFTDPFNNVRYINFADFYNVYKLSNNVQDIKQNLLNLIQL